MSKSDNVISGHIISDNVITVGRVVGLWRYPVKSMGAEALNEVQVDWNGAAGDRRWAFVRAGVERSGFPWFTLRQRADMNHYQPYFADPDNPDSSKTLVKTPAGDEFDVIDPALAKELAPDGAQVIKQNRGVFDAFPLSLITTQTVSQLGEWVNDELDVLSFRPNILVESTAGRPFEEDRWVGRVLQIGGIQMRVDKRDGRCTVITIDPTSAKSNPAVLKKVAKEREGCLGVYGSVVEPGVIAIGDEVLLPAHTG